MGLMGLFSLKGFLIENIKEWVAGNDRPDFP